MTPPATDAERPAHPSAPSGAAPGPGCATASPHGVFAECPHCGGGMAPEHAHYRCTSCGWRDSCCD